MSSRRTLLDVCLALAIGGAAFALSCLAETPGTHALSFGLTYQGMSEHPFAWQGLFPHRFLLPALAHTLGLVGDRFYLAAHGTAVLFLALVCWAARRLECGWIDASLLTLAAAFGGATQVYKSHVGYPDSLSFSLLLAAALCVRHGVLLWAFTLLGAFAHEQVLFFVPFLIWIRRSLAGATWRGEGIGAAVVIGIYGAFRMLVRAHATQDIRPDYYFGNGYFPLGFLGVMYLVVGWMVLVFGLQLAVLPVVYRTGVRCLAPAIDRCPTWQKPALWLYVLAILAIYCVAHDFNRFVNFLFLPLLLAQREFLRLPRSRWLLVAALVLQAIVTRYVLVPVSLYFYAPMTECHCLTGVPRDLQKLVTFVLPRVWPGVLALTALLGGILWSGRLLGRTTATEGNGATGDPEHR